VFLLDTKYATSNIAAMNAILGVVNFIILSLPDGWKVISDYLPPSVDRVCRVGRIKWALEGRITSLIVSPFGGGYIDIIVVEGNRVRKFDSEFSLNGHEGYYNVRNIKRGFFRRKRYRMVNISFYCKDTNRTLTMSLIIPFIFEDVEGLIEAVSSSVCH
jgi:hypothetical protein